MIVIPTINSFIRVLHALPEVGTVDVYVNDNLAFQNLAYKRVSKYLPIGPGTNRIQVTMAGDPGTTVIDTEIDIPPSEVLTLAITGSLEKVSILPIIQNISPLEPQETRVRFAHLAKDAPGLDVVLNEDPIFNNVGYKQVTDYMAISPGSYNLQVKPAGKEEPLATAEDVVFKTGQAYTIYGVGLVEGSPSLEIIFLEESLPVVKGENEKKEKQPAKSSTSSGIRIVFQYR